MNSPKRILWSANDPGGMNAIVPVIDALVARGDVVTGIATGPAVGIAKQKNVAVQDATNYTGDELQKNVAAARPGVFLAGTSGGDSIDKKIFRLIPHVPSVYVLDFWSGYRARFSKEGEDLAYLPSAICVMDELARQEMLTVGFEDAWIHVTGNPHTEHFTEGITREHEDSHELLFISQPVREAGDEKYGFDEYIVLEHLIRAVETLPEQFRFFIRLHPRDDSHKYDEYVNERVSMSPASSLEEALSTAGLVIGMFSPVLIQAAAVGKRVLSYEPGLKGEDPLATNRLGLTRKISDEKELQETLMAYSTGEPPPTALDVSALWPNGAAERILQVIDSPLQKEKVY